MPREAIEALTGSDMVAGRTAAVENALLLRLTSPGNVTVELEWQAERLLARGRAGPNAGRSAPRWASASRSPPPFRRFVRDGERGDGTYWEIRRTIGDAVMNGFLQRGTPPGAALGARRPSLAMVPVRRH